MRHAVIINGLLRRITRNRRLIEKIVQSGSDLFVVTSREEIDSVKFLLTIMDGAKIVFVEDHAAACLVEKELIATNKRTMLQWVKYWVAVELVMTHENSLGRQYDLISRLRTDYIFDDIESYFAEESLLSYLAYDGIHALSDIIFAGPRDYMVALKRNFHFFRDIYQRMSPHSIPVDLAQLRQSAVSWQFPSFPVIVRDRTENHESWSARVRALQVIRSDPQAIKQQILITHASLGPQDYLRLGRDSVVHIDSEKIYTSNAVYLFAAYPPAPSEAIFARFINLNGIKVNWSSALKGHLDPARKQGR